MTTTVQRTKGQAPREHLRALLAGLPGSGLSRTAATWPDPLYALAGSELTWMHDLDVPFVRVHDVDAFVSVVSGVSGSPDARQAAFGVPVGTLVVDTFDGLERILGNDPAKMRMILSTLAGLPLHVVVLCHVTADADRMVPATCVGDEIGTYVDLALLLAHRNITTHYEGVGVAEHRLARFVRAWPDVRHPWVLDRSGNLPAELPLTFDGDFARITAAMAPANGQAPPATTPAARGSKRAAPGPAAAAPAGPRATAPPEDADDEVGDEDDGDELPECTEKLDGTCLGRVESADALDLSQLRFRRPMCGPCEATAWAARPKKVTGTRKRSGGSLPPAAPPPAPAPVLQEAAEPRGERVGQFEQRDQDLRAFLREGLG